MDQIYQKRTIIWKRNDCTDWKDYIGIRFSKTLPTGTRNRMAQTAARSEQNSQQYNGLKLQKTANSSETTNYFYLFLNFLFYTIRTGFLRRVTFCEISPSIFLVCHPRTVVRAVFWDYKLKDPKSFPLKNIRRTFTQTVCQKNQPKIKTRSKQPRVILEKRLLAENSNKKNTFSLS